MTAGAQRQPVELDRRLAIRPCLWPPSGWVRKRAAVRGRASGRQPNLDGSRRTRSAPVAQPRVDAGEHDRGSQVCGATPFKNRLVRVSAGLASGAGVLPSASGTRPLGCMRANRSPAAFAASPVIKTAPTAPSFAMRAICAWSSSRTPYAFSSSIWIMRRAVRASSG